MRDGTAQAESSDAPQAIRVQQGDLAALPMLEGVSRTTVEKLAPAFSAFQYRGGALLLETGDSPPRLQIVQRGIVELCRVDEDGREYGVLLLSEKDIVMPASTILRERALLCARALTTTRTLEIDSALVRAALADSPQLAFNLLRVTSGQWRMAVRNILDLTARTAAQRLGGFLLRLADLQEGDPSPVLPIRKRYLAARLGIAPETLSRTLQTIAEHGLHLRGRSIVVRDRARIEEFCGPDPYPAGDERNQHVYAI